MPLSEREQKILQEIERDLYREDPGFARDVRRTGPGLSNGARLRLGYILFGVGFLTLLMFFVKQWLLLGVAAFGAMVAGVVLVTGSLRALASGRERRAGQPREWFSQALKRWEQRLRQRHKRS